MVFSPEVLLLHRDSHFTFSNNSLNIKCFIKIQLFVFYYIYHNFDSIYFDYENVHLVLFRYVLLTLFYLFFSNYQFYQLLSCLSKYNLHWEDSFWGFDCYNAIYRLFFQTNFYLEFNCTWHPFPHCLTHWLTDSLTFTLKMSSHLKAILSHYFLPRISIYKDPFSHSLNHYWWLTQWLSHFLTD